MRHRFPCGKLTLLLLIIGLATAQSEALSFGAPGLLTLPSFEQQCQVPGAIRYLWQSRDVGATFSAGGIVEFFGPQGALFRMTFPGGNVLSQPLGEQQLTQKTFYYLGNRKQWREGSHFARVRYRDLYPGIALVFSTNSGRLEYSFEVAPHADPGRIRIRYVGANPLEHGGDLESRFPGISLLQSAPRAFQQQGPSRHSIPCRYLVTKQDEVKFETGRYDQHAALTIDPILTFSTFIGPSGFTAIYSMTTDSTGNLYIAGETSAGNLWNSAWPERSSHDAFIVKMNSSGTQVLYTVYLGGSGNDAAKSVAVDASGNAYLAGVTASADFPVTSGAFSTIASGPQNAFVAKLNSVGALQYSTYLGGTTADFGDAIAVDSTGAAYIAGQTQSTLFPVTDGTVGPIYNGGISDCFVSKLNPAGSALVYSTYLGGSGLDACSGIAVDPAGDAYVTGVTYSANFPTQNQLQGSGGSASAFVSELNPTGSALIYSTYLGGTNVDEGYAIAVDSSGNTYVAGATASIDFPVTSGAYQTSMNGIYNAFVAKLAPGGASLVYATLIGGSGSDTAASIAVDSTGRVFVAGYTSSINFPTQGAPESLFSGGFDAFASVLNPQGSALLFSSYFGGAGNDFGYAVALAPGGSFYAGGMTSSPNFPVSDSFQATLGGSPSSFLLEVSALVDLALDQPASQSSTYDPGFTNASNAVDGNTDGVYGDGSLSHTNDDPNAWWEVDLGRPVAVNSIMIWNRTDCCGFRLSDYWVFVSNTPFLATDTPATLQNRAGTWSSYQTAAPNPNANIIIPGAQGRFVRIQLAGTNYLALAEVQVYGTVLQDVALFQTASQSSTYDPGFTNASNAVDGNTDGVYGDGSLSHTDDSANAWWEVDLGTTVSVGSILVWNRTDCCGSRLSDYWVFVSNIPFASTDTPATLQGRVDTYSSHQTVAPNPVSTIVIPGAQGRYVRVQLTGTNYLALAEVQVYPVLQQDLALNQTATQSSTYEPGFTNASNAVDGDTDGVFGDRSLSHTDDDVNAWWEVDLGASMQVGSVVVWNRTDCCGSRLSDYWVFVSNTPFLATDTPSTLENRAATWSSHQTVQPDPSSRIVFPAVEGRYVRVQLTGTNYLGLAEVQVFSQ
jgi:hypothetical protein